MPYWIVDVRDRVAQEVTPNAEAPTDPRFIKVEASTARGAFERALPPKELHS